MAKVNYLDKGISSMQPVINVSGIAATTAAPVVMKEDKCLGYINVRIGAEDSSAAQAAAGVLGVALPSINCTASTDTVTVIGLSPNEWVVVTPAGEEGDMTASLISALEGFHSLVADVTGGYTTLTITGDKAQDLLEKGTYVDLHDVACQPGQLYGTQIAHAPAVIVKNGSNDFSLLVRRSFSDHIARWAVDAAGEYGYTFV